MPDARRFGFDLKVSQVNAHIEIVYGGGPVANLSTCPSGTCDVVSSGTSNGPQDPAQLVIDFDRRPLVSLDNGRFETFIAAIADTGPFVSFELAGGADVVTDLVIGMIPITGIPFDVPTNFPGINSFNGQITVTGIPDTYGSGTASDRFSFSASNPGAHGSDFISILTIVNLLNPSPIMLTTNDNALPVYYQGAFVGVAAIANLGLLPAAPYATNNTLPATRVTEGVVSQLQYQPAVGDATAYQLVTQYLYGTHGQYSNGIVPITINTQPTNLVPTSPYDSLVPALRGIKPVNSQFQALGTSQAA